MIGWTAMKITRSSSLPGACVALALLAGCAATPEQPAAPAPEPAPEPAVPSEPAPSRREAIVPPVQDRIEVGLLLPLSGETRGVGLALRDAAALALFDANDPRLALVPFDTRGTPEGAREAAERAVAAGVRVVLGPLLSDSVDAAAPPLRQAGIPLIGFSNDRRVAQRGVYLMGFMPGQEVRRIVEYAARSGHERFAGLIPINAYGERVFAAFGPAVLAADGEIVSLSRYEADPDRLAEPVRRLARYEERRAAYEAEVAFLDSLGDDLSQQILDGLENKETLRGPGFDAVLIAEGDPLVRTLAPLLPFYEVDPAEVRFLGTGLWDVPSLSREPPLRGAWFPAPDPDRPRAFLARFKRIYGRAAPRLATLAYDGMALITRLARDPVKEQRFTDAAFRDPAGFTGLDGAFRFAETGIAQRRLAVIAIRRNGFEVIDPAPKGFQRPAIGALASEGSPKG